MINQRLVVTDSRCGGLCGLATRLLGLILLISTVLLPAGLQAQTDDALEQAKSWQPPTVDAISAAFDVWMPEARIEDATQKGVRELLDQSRDQFDRANSLDLILTMLISARPDLQPIRDALQQQPEPGNLPGFDSVLENEAEQIFVRDHVRLMYGKWLAQNDFFDESLQQLSLSLIHI